MSISTVCSTFFFLVEQPGRVVTLVETRNQQDHVWGIAYEVEDDSEIVAKLDYREKDGYEKIRTMFYPCEDEHSMPFEIEVYVGDERNPFFVGPASLKEMARQIYEAEGPSGKNSEYLFCLADSIRKLTPEYETVDHHLFELESAVKKLCHESNRQ